MARRSIPAAVQTRNATQAQSAIAARKLALGHNKVGTPVVDAKKAERARLSYPMAPSLKRAIVDVTPRQTLAKIVDALGVAAVDRRSGRAMAQALVRAKRARAEEMLGYLDDETLRRACTLFQVRPTTSRSQTIDRLVKTDVYRASGSEVALHSLGPFVAVSVLCADPGRDSLCALQMVRVEGGRATKEIHHLVRPPRRRITGAAAAAGIEWSALKSAPSFSTVWNKVKPLLDDTAFIAAHNGAYVRSVIGTSCAESRLDAPRIPVQCTGRLARRMWRLENGSLDTVQSHLGVPRAGDVLGSTTQTAIDVVLAAQKAARR